MKQIAIEEVKKSIWGNCFECDENNVEYYLHVTEEGNIVDGCIKADESFVYRVPFERFIPEFYEKDIKDEALRKAVDKSEVDGNEIFEEVAKNLCDQANKWLKEL